MELKHTSISRGSRSNAVLYAAEVVGLEEIFCLYEVLEVFISTFRNALNCLTNICQMLLLSSPSQEEKGMCRGVFCLGIFQIITYAHIYMLVSVYVKEDKVIEKCLYVCCWSWQGFVMVILALWSLLLDMILGWPWKKCFLFHWQAESPWQLGCRCDCVSLPWSQTKSVL